MALTYPQYQNGGFPLSMMVKLVGSGGENHYLPPATAAKWYELQRRAAARRKAKGLPPLPLLIWPGWDAYRPYDAQVAAQKNACAQGNCLAAATPRTSSHGLVFRGKDAAALDAGNWSAVYQGDYEAFFADARAVGFVADFIRPGVNGYPLGTPREFWHLFDFDPWGPVPAFDGATPFPTQEEDMSQADIDSIQQKLDDLIGAIGAGNGRSLPVQSSVLANVRASVTLGNALVALLAPVQRIIDGQVASVSLRQEIADAKSGVLQLLGRPTGEVPDVDEAALAKALAPLLSQNVGRFTDDDLTRFAKAVADESDRRERERLGKA
jgi:hypothetical protein